MYYVYILRSLSNQSKIYTGYTSNLERRLEQHNLGLSTYTSKFTPWKVETYICFNKKSLAKDFEKYLKSGSGIAFLKKRFLVKWN